MIKFAKNFPEHQRNEEIIVAALVQRALNKGFAITVHDGGEFILACSTDFRAIMAALNSTDEDTISFYPEGSRRLTGWPGRTGWVSLVWGNDTDVISDYNDSDLMNDLVGPINDLAEALQELKQSE